MRTCVLHSVPYQLRIPGLGQAENIYPGECAGNLEVEEHCAYSLGCSLECCISDLEVGQVFVRTKEQQRMRGI